MKKGGLFYCEDIYDLGQVGIIHALERKNDDTAVCGHRFSKIRMSIQGIFPDELLCEECKEIIGEER